MAPFFQAGGKFDGKSECHFDHILAYAKGGKSSLDNCQILCSVCNLSKSDKDMQDFLLEEKAKRFMAGENIEVDITSSQKNSSITNEKMTKERFDEIVEELFFLSVEESELMGRMDRLARGGGRQ